MKKKATWTLILLTLAAVIGLTMGCPSPSGGDNTNPSGSDDTYIITGSGTAFTATKDGVTVGIAGQPINNVINAIRADADGETAVAIQFGNGGTLDIGVATANFDNGGGETWGLITLSGKITSQQNVTPFATVRIATGVSATSLAEITNNATDGQGIRKEGTGTVNITGGTVSATGTGTSRAVCNQSSGTVNISGTATVSAPTGTAVYNESSGLINISGGTVSSSTGRAVFEYGGGKITVSGGIVTSANTFTTQGTITLGNVGTGTAVRLEITGGTVSHTSTGATANAVYNDSTGAVNITGGTVRTSASTGNYAVYNARTGSVTIGAGATIVGNQFL